MPSGEAVQTVGADDAEWHGMLRQLVCYRMQNGRPFSSKHGRRHPELATWLERQARLHRKGRLSPQRQRELEALGGEWDSGDDQTTSGNSTEARWEARFAELAAFQKEHGHLRVTHKNQPSAGLMHWRDNQRLRFEAGTMTPEQKARLDEIGFEWEPPGRVNPAMEQHNVELWEGMFAKLLAFRQEHGHCQVPRSRAKDGSLATWVTVQRRHYRDHKLLPERQRRLEEIGFAWKSDFLHFVGGWEARFAELVAFKEKHGHLRTTKKNQLSPGFMHWRDNQRLRLRRGVMPPEQKARLDAIGFEWENPTRLSPSKQEHIEAQWEAMFAELLAYRAKHGHCQVPFSKKSDVTLGKWVRRQRHHHRKNTLLPERRRRLEEIGFKWEPDKLHFAEGWEGRFAELVAFQEKHGHLRITKTNESSPGLSHWRDNQRIRLRSGAMKPWQKAKLDAIGFEWEPPGWHTTALVEHAEHQWESKFAELTAFKAARGHCRVPKNCRDQPGLGQWLSKQRRKFRKGSGEGGLLPERLARLDALGTEWRESPPPSHKQPKPALHRVPKNQWDSRYARLAEFHRLNGHANVPGHPDRLLRKWVLEQRVKHAEGSLEADQVTRLEALGFSWQTPNRRPVSNPAPRERHLGIWDQRFTELQAFVNEHGHFRVPKKKEEFKKLRHWVVAQRVYQRQGSMSAAHREKLDALGFPWQPGQRGGQTDQDGSQTWEDHWQSLAAFKEKHGHARVMCHRGPERKLGGWLARQRVLHRQGRLPQDRFQRLDALGVDWNPGKTAWVPDSSERGSSDQRMAELREFHARHGHADVPTKYPPNQLLGNWVSNTRISYKKGQLSAGRIQQLEELGFHWRGMRKNFPGIAASWEENFAALLEFQKQHGHPNVQSTDVNHPVLATWVVTQRVRHRRGLLKADRVQKLESIGFHWGRSEYRPDSHKSWDQRYAELVAFRRQHGHPHVSRADQAHRSLDIWAKTQRVCYHQGKLSADQIQRLESIGFTWDGNKGWWERQFRRWEAATQRRRTRHLTVIGDADDDLAKWEQTQRNLHRLGRLDADKASKLRRAGLIFEAPPPDKSGLQMPHQKLHA